MAIVQEMASETPLLHIFYSYPSTFVTLHHAPSTLRLPRNSTSSLIYKDSLVRSCSLESFPQLCIAPLRKKKSQVWSVQGFIWICYIYIYCDLYQIGHHQSILFQIHQDEPFLKSVPSKQVCHLQTTIGSGSHEEGGTVV